MFVNTPQQLAEKKLLLLYIFDKIQTPLSNQQITQLILENDIMNYFMLQQFLGELKESDFIIEGQKEQSQRFSITDKGKNTLNYFKNRIPHHEMSNIDGLVEKKREDFKQKFEVKADYIALNNNDYMVKLSIIEGDLTKFSLKLNASNADEAKNICNNWKRNSDTIYTKMIDFLNNQR